MACHTKHGKMDKEQFEAALKAAVVDVKYAHLASMKPGNEGIIYMKYIPVQIVETQEEMQERLRKERAGKMFARVKMINDNSKYRSKRGEVINTMESDNGKKMFCLRIETMNTCNKSGFMTLVGVSKSCYIGVWFPEDELTDFEVYDKDGKLVEMTYKLEDAEKARAI